MILLVRLVYMVCGFEGAFRASQAFALRRLVRRAASISRCVDRA